MQTRYFDCIGSESPRQYFIDPSHCPLFIRSTSLAFNPSEFCQIMLHTIIIKKYIPFVESISTIFTLSLQSDCHYYYSPTHSAFLTNTYDIVHITYLSTLNEPSVKPDLLYSSIEHTSSLSSRMSHIIYP